MTPIFELMKLPRWQVMARAIEYGESAEVADELGLAPETVRRWRVERRSDENPTERGVPSPLDRFCELLKALAVVNPKGAEMLVDYITEYHQQCRDRGQQPPPNINVTLAEIEQSIKTMERAKQALQQQV